MRLVLKPTEDNPEYKWQGDGRILERRRPLGFMSGDNQNHPPLLNGADMYYLAWAWLPHRYFLSILDEGDKAYVEGFGKYRYGILQGGKTYRSESRGDTSCLTGDSDLLVGDILCVDCDERLKFVLMLE